MALSIITTGANELMAPIHDRRPVVLEEGRITGYLAPESLSVDDSPNPLIKPKGTSVQGELF